MTEIESAEGALEELLSERADEAERRASEHLRADDAEALVLYGAGTLGRHVAGRLRRAGVRVAAFADDTPEKHGQVIEGLRVLTPAEAAERFGARSLFAVTIHNPAASYLKVKRRLEDETGARVVSFLSLAWAYPAHLLPHYQFELPSDLLAKAARVREGFRLFEDAESRRQYVAHLRFRLRLDFEGLPESNFGDYFPAGVVPVLGEDATFVDCGAFDGDTVRRFVERQRGRFGEIYAFEPDADNFRKLSAYAETLGAPERVHLFRAAVGARRARLRFDASGGMGSALSEAGAQEVEVLPVGEVVHGGAPGALFLKFDVEGAEAEALEGAADLVGLARAVTAVCVYHRPDDLWELPLRLRALAPGHQLFLRTQGSDGMDVVCYAVPRV